MKIDLDKQDLICLVKGSEPHHDIMNDPLLKTFGFYRGGFYDEWRWEEHNLKNTDEITLFKLYKMCKQSWNRE